MEKDKETFLAYNKFAVLPPVTPAQHTHSRATCV